MKELLAELDRWRQRNEPIALATLVAIRGSAPRLPALDPQLASSLLEFSVLRQLSQGLLGFDKDLILTPLVAANVPTVENGGISADGLTYTFKLRDAPK